MKISIKRRMVAVFLFLAVVPVLVTTIFFVLNGKKNERDTAIAQHEEKLLRVGTQLEGLVKTNSVYLETGVRLGGFAQLDDIGRFRLLEKMLSKRDAIRNIYFIDKNGIETITLSNSKVIIKQDKSNRSSSEEFLFPMGTGENYCSDVLYDPDSNEPLVTISIPVASYAGGATVGVVAAQIRFKPIWTMIASLNLKDGEDLYLVDSQGRVVAHHDPSIVLSEKKINLNKKLKQQVGLRGNEVLSSFYTVKFNQQRFVAVGEMDYATVMAPIVQGVILRISITVGLLVVALALFYWFSNGILGPIEEIAATARAIREGNLTRRVDIRRNDEIGDMAESFNAMTTKITTMVSELKKEVAARAEVQNSLLKLNRAYEALSMGSDAAARADSELGLYKAVCEIVRKDCDYLLAWIGIAECDSEKSVRPVAYDGFENGYLENMMFSWGDNEYGQGPAGRAIREARPIIFQDTATNTAFAPWREHALQRGYASLTAFPIVLDGTAIGVLAVYAKEKNAFSQDEVTLLQRLVETVSSGVAKIRAQKALQELNNKLEERVLYELGKNREKDLLLIRQSRLAAMGEMIHNIAHQWRQPLNALGILLSNIKDDYVFGEMTKESLDRDTAKGNALLQRMSKTIDDFRDFFRPDKEATVFDLRACVDDALMVMDASLQNSHIKIIKEYSDKEALCVGHGGQLSQAALNMISNAKEVIIERRIENGEINIKISADDQKVTLSVSDNGGGIAKEALLRVFDPYFTTKEQGSGIGLYMTKMIVERNHNGSIEVHNDNNGAVFTITLPLASKGTT